MQLLAFFDDPELLIGVPLLALGVFGAVIALATAFAPEPTAPGARAAAAHSAHPTEAEYIKIGIFLAVVTALEVLTYYIDIPRTPFITILVVMAIVKFAAVVMWFMHLKFDSGLFTTAFVTGLALAFAVFTVVVATLGANIV